MKCLNVPRIGIVVLGVILGVLAGGGSAWADFTFGEPLNLGATVNSSSGDSSPTILAAGLSLIFRSDRPGGWGKDDIWMTVRQTVDDPWESPVNLGGLINSTGEDLSPDISADGLTLYFSRTMTGGDLWKSTRVTPQDDWSAPVNLGPLVNSPDRDDTPNISADGLTLYFSSERSGGYGDVDIYMTTRATTNDDWGQAENLGPVLNGPDSDRSPRISADGLCLFFMSNRTGGFGNFDIWVTTRPTSTVDWRPPVNLGPSINRSGRDGTPYISADGRTLIFSSNRPGGFGAADLWQAQLIPIVDFNADGVVDLVDLVLLIDNWGADDTLYDIGPMPWGDGVIDIEDLKVFIAEWEKKNLPAQP
jgi:hypothetical protein